MKLLSYSDIQLLPQKTSQKLRLYENVINFLVTLQSLKMLTKKHEL